MDRRVVLHIGTMKTGTSFIQSVLGNNQAALAESGVEFPGGFGVQARAVREMLKLPQQPRRNSRRWTKLARGARGAHSPADSRCRGSLLVGTNTLVCARVFDTRAHRRLRDT